MSNVSAELRIFPNKEMFSVDMAEVLAAAILKDGIIQGCDIAIENHVLKFKKNGRMVINGRLGVITAGDVPIPSSITTRGTYSVVAVCDLRGVGPEFYISIATPTDIQSLNSAKSSGDGFNVEGTLDYITLGTVDIDPATGLASNWLRSASTAVPHKGSNIYTELLDRISALSNSVNDKLTWKIVNGEYTGTSKWVTIPASAKEIIVTVFIAYSASNKTSIDFHLPVNDVMWETSASVFTHVNHWASTNDGFVQIRTMKNNDGRHVKLYKAFNQTRDVTENTVWLVWYR